MTTATATPVLDVSAQTMAGDLLCKTRRFLIAILGNPAVPMTTAEITRVAEAIVELDVELGVRRAPGLAEDLAALGKGRAKVSVELAEWHEDLVMGQGMLPAEALAWMDRRCLAYDMPAERAILAEPSFRAYLLRQAS